MNEMVLWLKAYEESQFQTQLSGRLDTIPEFFPVLERALQPLEPHLLCRLLPSKTPYQRRPRRYELRPQKAAVLPLAPTLLRVHRAKHHEVQSCRAGTKSPLHKRVAPADRGLIVFVPGHESELLSGATSDLH